MPSKIDTPDVRLERRIAPRYIARFPIRAEWRDSVSGEKIVSAGATENVGQGSALVTLDPLPAVGSRVRIAVLDENEKLRCAATTEVLRIERHPGHPLAALQLLDAVEKWSKTVWQAAAPPPLVKSANEEDADGETEI